MRIIDDREKYLWGKSREERDERRGKKSESPIAMPAEAASRCNS